MPSLPKNVTQSAGQEGWQTKSDGVVGGVVDNGLNQIWFLGSKAIQSYLLVIRNTQRSPQMTQMSTELGCPCPYICG